MDKKVKTLAIKVESKAEQEKIAKLKAFDSSYSWSKSHFENDGTQNYLVLQPIQRYFKKISNAEHISAWNSNELFNGNIKPTATSDNSLAPGLSYVGNKMTVKLEGQCLKQEKATFTYGKNTKYIHCL